VALVIKEFLLFWIRALPLVIGIISTLTAFAFLIEFTAGASFDNLEDEEFWGFVLFALIGLPLTLFSIDRLAAK
jgi:hypothetical protein